MTDKAISICPLCNTRNLVAHCGDEHQTCTWHKCRNDECDAILDLAMRRGHRKTEGGRGNVTLGAAS